MDGESGCEGWVQGDGFRRTDLGSRFFANGCRECETDAGNDGPQRTDTGEWMQGKDAGNRYRRLDVGGWTLDGPGMETKAGNRGGKLDEGEGCPEVTVCWPCGLLARTSLGVERVPVSLRCAERTRQGPILQRREQVGEVATRQTDDDNGALSHLPGQAPGNSG